MVRRASKLEGWPLSRCVRPAASRRSGSLRSRQRTKSPGSMCVEFLEDRRVLASISGQVYLDANNNSTRDTAEMGIPGVQITLLNTGGSGSTTPQTTLTLDDGTFLFDNLAASTYRLLESQPKALTDGQETTGANGATAGSDDISNITLADGQTIGGNNFGERALLPEYVSIVWFFASSKSQPTVLREMLAKSEDRAGNSSLARSIREGKASSDGATNLPPTVANDAFQVNPNNVLTVPVATGVLANDRDPEGATLSVSTSAAPTNGSLTLNTDGSFTYTPKSNFAGTDSFRYSAIDRLGAATTGTVTITVANTSNNFSVAENTAVGTLVGRVPRAASGTDTVTYSLVTTGQNSALTLRPDENVKGNPAAPMVLIEYMDLSSSDTAELDSLAGELELDFPDDLIIVRRHAPSASSANAVAAARAAEAASLQDAFDDMVAILLENQDEWVDATDPTELFTGYADDLELNVTKFTTDLNSTAVQQRVQRDRDSATALGVTGAPVFFLNGQKLDNDQVADDFAELIDNAMGGFLDPFVINRQTGDLFVATASKLDFETTPQFTLTVRNTTASGTNTDGTVTVAVTNVNEAAPVATADNLSVVQGQTLTLNAANGVLKNDTDADGGSLTAKLVTNVTNGTLTLNADGSLVYTPRADFSGTDSFTYQANDGTRDSNLASVVITVNPVASTAPVASNDIYFTTQNTVLAIATSASILLNDTDPNGDSLTAQLVNTTANGSLSLNANGSFNYTPNTGFSGNDTFSYRASDGTLTSNLATVTITVNAVNAAPVAAADTYSVNEGTILTVNATDGVLKNDTDANSNPLTAQLVANPNNGSLTLNSNGSFTYTPLSTFVGADSFTYRASDGTATSAITTVTINVVNVNVATPVAVNDTFSINEDSDLNVTATTGLLANDTDADGDPLSVQLVTNVTHGTLSLNANGSFSYRGAQNFAGTDSFTYRTTDGVFTSSNATVTLTVQAVNDAPVVQADAYQATRNTVLSIAAAEGVLKNDTDADGTNLLASVFEQAAHGNVLLAANGAFQYTPDDGFTGTDTFKYQVSDGTVTATATVTITVSVASTAAEGEPDDGSLLDSAAVDALMAEFA